MADEEGKDWKSTLARIVLNPPLLLVLFGAALLAASAAGGIDKIGWHLNEPTRQRIVMLTGAAVLLLGITLIFKGGSAESRISGCGFRILSPYKDADVGEDLTEFSGTYKKKGGERIVMVEQSPNGKYWFKSEEVYLIDKENWSASFRVGGSADARRIIYVAVLGKSGAALYDYSRVVANETGKWPGMPRLTEDIELSEGVRVRKKTAVTQSAAPPK
jgi:hypothetical protein